MSTKDKEYFKEHRKNSFTQWSYSIQRKDLLIVSLSGGGVYVVMELLKYAVVNNTQNSCMLKICGVIFVFALILNFISQHTGEKANDYEMKWADEKIDDNEKAATKYSQKADLFSEITECMNLSSMIAMFIGLLILAVYFLINF